MGGLHSSETGPSEMMMELVYRIATETSPFITPIRDNVYVSVTPVADADGRDRNVDQFYCSQDLQAGAAAVAAVTPVPPGAGRDNRGRRVRPARLGTAAPPQGRGAGGGAGFGGGGGGAQCALPYWGKLRLPRQQSRH